MKIIHFYYFDSDPRFPPFLLYVRWKSGVTFVWRCFRDVSNNHHANKPVQFRPPPPFYSKTRVYRGIHYFPNFAQNTECKYLLERPNLTRTHRLCFEQKKRSQFHILDPSFHSRKITKYCIRVLALNIVVTQKDVGTFSCSSLRTFVFMPPTLKK